MVDMVVDRHALRETLIRLLDLLRHLLARPERGRAGRIAALAASTAPHGGSDRRRAVRPTVPPNSAAILDRLTGLHPKVIDLSLGRIERLLDRLGRPQEQLPPVRARRRHQRQGLGGGVPAGDAGGGRATRCTSTRRRTWCASPSASSSPAARSTRRALCRHPRGVRGGQRRRADHLLRDHHRRGLSRLRPHAGRRDAAGNRSRRPARCDQRRDRAGADRDHADFARSSSLPGRHAGRDRLREGRNSQARRRLRLAPRSRPRRRRSSGAARRSIGAPLFEEGRDWSVGATRRRRTYLPRR